MAGFEVDVSGVLQAHKLMMRIMGIGGVGNRAKGRWLSRTVGLADCGGRPLKLKLLIFHLFIAK